MSESLPIWKHQYQPSRAIRRGAVTIALVFLGYLLGIPADLERQVARPIAHSIREAMRMGVALDPRIRLIENDLIASGSPESATVTSSSLAVLLAVARQNPGLIIVKEGALDDAPKEEALNLIDSLVTGGTPLVFAADWLEANGVHPQTTGQAPIRQPAWFDAGELARSPLAGSGPDHLTRPASAAVGVHYSAVGHSLYTTLGFKPFIRSVEGQFVPAAPLLAAGKVKIEEAGLSVNGRAVPLDHTGHLALMPLRPDKIREQTLTMTSGLTALDRTGRLNWVSKGDYIVIAPATFSPLLPWVTTPSGHFPASHYEVAALNQVLKGQWPRIAREEQDLLLAVAAVVTAATLVFPTVGAPAYLILAGGAVTIATAGFALLMAFDWSFSWVFVTLAWCGAGILVLVDKRQMARRYVARLEDALRGQMSVDQISDMLRNPEKLDLQPRNSELTMMFVDLVGFSRSAEELPAEQLFGQLKDHLQEMRSIIHKHHGFIDRSLGDGLLCYFGYRPDGYIPGNGRHSDQALACAVELQQMNLQRNLAAKSTNRIAHPMRIGMNTATVCLGDLGDANRIDITVIGHGVNFAKRLETACENYRVMMSNATRDALAPKTFDTNHMHKRLVQIKHHTELLDAFEYDPLGGLEEEKLEAMRHYWSLIGVKRKDARYSVSNKVLVEITTTSAVGRIVNFSSTGFAIQLDRYLACGVTIAFMLDDTSGVLGEECRRRRIVPIEAEIRWGQATPKGFLHGAMIKGLNSDNRQWLFEQLSRYSTASLDEDHKNSA